MSTNNAPIEPHLRKTHESDKYGTKLVDKAGKWQHKATKFVHRNKHRHHKHRRDSSSSSSSSSDDNHHKGPAGGYDATPLPTAEPGYTIRITFHRAENLPFSDFPRFSTDAYIHATLRTSLEKRHKQDPDLFLRTPTIHRNTDPQWETQWVIAHVPASGFFLKCRLYDEDPADHDDRLGNVHVNVPQISEGWRGIEQGEYELKKRMGSKRAYTFRGAAALLRSGARMHAKLVVSFECLGRSPGTGGRCYVVAPLPWVRHHSPLIGRIAGTKDREEKDKRQGKSTGRYNFQAVQMQMRGPVPAEMYHRYVEFKPFIAGMFTDVTLRGRILNRALHHQHARIYNYDTSTVYGVFERPCVEMTKQFLEFVHYDQGGRIYTYVISLDGLWRFTETGKEFGIDMLSKHTMHSDVSIYIAFSGEFFVRRLKRPRGHDRGYSNFSTTSTGSSDPVGDIEPPSHDPENDAVGMGEHQHNDIPKDPSYYELIIDNDSGTYRPNAELLPLLKVYMQQNLPGLKVATLDCQRNEQKMRKLKSEQRERRERSGKQTTYLQNSSMSSLSSSDEEELDARANGAERPSPYKKGMAKLQGYRQNNGDSTRGMPAEDGYLRPNSRGTLGGGGDSISERDSRDYTSSASANSQPQDIHWLRDGEQSESPQQLEIDINRRRKDSGYANRDLPTLLKKDANGQIARPQEYSEGDQKEENVVQDDAYGVPETGDHKPLGGISYGKIVSTAGVERVCPLGVGNRGDEGGAVEQAEEARMHNPLAFTAVSHTR